MLAASKRIIGSDDSPKNIDIHMCTDISKRYPQTYGSSVFGIVPVSVTGMRNETS